MVGTNHQSLYSCKSHLKIDWKIIYSVQIFLMLNYPFEIKMRLKSGAIEIIFKSNLSFQRYDSNYPIKGNFYLVCDIKPLIHQSSISFREIFIYFLFTTEFLYWNHSTFSKSWRYLKMHRSIIKKVVSYTNFSVWVFWDTLINDNSILFTWTGSCLDLIASDSASGL